MTDLRTAAKAALWAFQYHVEQTWPTDRSTAAIAALRAALAQQDEPCPNCASLEAQNTELDRKLAELEQEPVDMGLLEYRGNSVAFIHQKMTAYRAGIDAAWDAFRAKGLHPDGKTPLANMIAKYTAPPQRKPLTDEEIDELSRTMVKGDKSVNWLCRAIERAHGIGEAK